MRAAVERIRRNRDGGAMAEYGILLALASGVQWAERATRDLEPTTIVGAVAAVVLVMAWVLKR
jgi:hypothetical protein